MKKHIILSLTILFLGITALSSQQNDWENPRVFGINKMPGRATSVSYTSVEQALAFDHAESERVLSLNGTWKFSFAEKPSTPDYVPLGNHRRRFFPRGP